MQKMKKNKDELKQKQIVVEKTNLTEVINL
jgi:hypothetical protein